MHIVMGATGHVGSAVVEQLLARREPVTVVTRSAQKGAAWRARGAQVATLDVRDVDALTRVLRSGTRAFLLNPPGDPTGDVVREERANAAAITRAVEQSRLEHVVLQSTYGAQPGSDIGDLGVLYELEQWLARQPTPVHAIRAAYFMSNWDGSLEPARKGRLPSFFPEDFRLPMVAPRDIAELASRLMVAPPPTSSLVHIEGPERYSAKDVARAFADALGRVVKVEAIAEPRWIATMRSLGLSAPSAQSMAAMTRITRDVPYEPSSRPERGTTSLAEYVATWVRGAGEAKGRSHQ